MELPLPEISAIDHPGLVESGRCPVTGRVLWTRPEWNVDLPHYQNELFLLAPGIVFARSRGFIYGENTLAYLKRFELLWAEASRPGLPICMIEDWTELRGADTLARRTYVAYHVENRDRYAGFSFFGMNALTRTMISLGRKLFVVPFALEVSRTYEEALSKALLMVGAQKERARSPLPSMPVPTVPLLEMSSLPDRELRDHARRLEDIFGQIPWDRQGEPANPLAIQDPFHDLVAGWIAVKTDLDDLHQRNRKLEKNFRAIMESAQEGVWIADVGGDTLWANGTMATMMGVSIEKMEGLRLENAIPASLAREAGFTAIAAGELRLMRPDGSAIWVLASAGPLPPDVDGTGGIYVICADITARRHAETEVRRLNEDLEMRVEERTAELADSNRKLADAVRAREEFLAALSHELRTPLATMLSVAESLRAGVHGYLPTRQDERLALIEKNGRHLKSLIDDVLDLTKSIAGSLSLNLEVVDLAELSRQCLASIREMTLARGIALVSEIPTFAVVAVIDPLRVRQILLNLLSNAGKFSPPGSTMGLRFEPQNDKKLLVLEVWDLGPGIAPQSQAKLFKPFVQLDSRLAREHGGAGLGLALSRRLAEAHGGTVEFDGSPGKGAAFRVILPWIIGASIENAARKSGAIPRDDKLGPSLLLVEDNQDLRDTIHEYFLSEGWVVRAASGGSEALEIFAAHPFDVVLMDIQMPGMDGLEAIRRIRENAQGRVAKIVAMSGLAFPDDKERVFLAGADLHLSKPVRLQSLLELVSGFSRSQVRA